MSTNMIDFIKVIKQGNPQAFVMNILQQDAQKGNPIAVNLIQMINSGDSRGIEQVARNIAKEKGIDFDKEFSKFKNQFNSFKQMFRDF